MNFDAITVLPPFITVNSIGLFVLPSSSSSSIPISMSSFFGFGKNTSSDATPAELAATVESAQKLQAQAQALLADNKEKIDQVRDVLAADGEDKAIGEASKKQMGGAAIIGGVLGFLVPIIHGPLIAIALAVAAAGACATSTPVGEMARKTGDNTMDAVPKLTAGCKQCVSGAQEATKTD